MGKKKIDNEKYIPDRNLRNITYHKRKRGLLKKIIEICQLCDLNIYMFLFDRDKNKIVQFKSHDSFDSFHVSQFLNEIKKEEI
jgi:hypothetical protein